MADFCIPKQLADSLKEAAKRGEIDIAKMYEMNSEQRREVFKKYVDENTAKQINTGFEKAMISTQKNALKKWAESVFTPKEKASPRYKDVIDKINTLDEMGVLTPDSQEAFLQDLVSSKLGATVTAEEAAVISQKAKKLEALKDQKSEFNTPTIEYFKLRKEMEDYLDSLEPSSKLRVLTETIARGTMLARLSSPLLNIESNTVQGLLSTFARRIETRKLGGVNNKYALKYAKFVNEVYAKTGYDVSRLRSIQSDRQIRGEEKSNTQGPGVIRKIGRTYEDLIFKKTQGAPDVAFSSFHFSDRANIESTKIAQGEGLKGEALDKRALEIFKDATSITPETELGGAVRDAAIADAEFSTYTNKSKMSDLALGIRKLFNLASGDMRVGDQIMPFVKTPANVIQAGLDYSGITVAPDTFMRGVKFMKEIHEGVPFDDARKEAFKGWSTKIIRAGLGVTFAYLLSNLFKPDDFIGEFPVSQKEQELLRLRNANTNSVKIGNRWWSLDYFGPLGTAMVGFLYAKKYGNNLPDKVFNYVKGSLRQSARLPGFDETYNFIQSLKEATPSNDKTLKEEMQQLANYALSFSTSRLIPGLVSDIAKATDENQRQTNSKDQTSVIKANIPVVRQNTLPEKYTVLGDSLKGEGWLTLLTGARVKTVNEDPVIDELVRLNSTDNLPSITDVSKTSPRAKELKQQIGEEKFNEAMQELGTRLKKEINDLITSPQYPSYDDTEKKKMIDSAKNDIFDGILGDYNYTPAEKN